jgi:hypothetical protein
MSLLKLKQKSQELFLGICWAKFCKVVMLCFVRLCQVRLGVC